MNLSSSCEQAKRRLPLAADKAAFLSAFEKPFQIYCYLGHLHRTCDSGLFVREAIDYRGIKLQIHPDVSFRERWDSLNAVYLMDVVHMESHEFSMPFFVFSYSRKSRKMLGLINLTVNKRIDGAIEEEKVRGFLSLRLSRNDSIVIESVDDCELKTPPIQLGKLKFGLLIASLTGGYRVKCRILTKQSYEEYQSRGVENRCESKISWPMTYVLRHGKIEQKISHKNGQFCLFCHNWDFVSPFALLTHYELYHCRLKFKPLKKSYSVLKRGSECPKDEVVFEVHVRSRIHSPAGFTKPPNYRSDLCRIERYREYYPDEYFKTHFMGESGYCKDDWTQTWLRQYHESRINDFFDIGQSERSFMLLWARFSYRRKILSDKDFFSACSDFLVEHKDELAKYPNLQGCFVLHITTCFDHSILSIDHAVELFERMQCLMKTSGRRYVKL